MTEANSSDPYKILGLGKDCTSRHIQKRYRELCLKYHPDKNGHRLPNERNKYEENFKIVQKAYSLIGDEESRSSYDNHNADFRTTSASPNYHSSSSPYGTDPIAEAFFRAFQQAGGIRTSFHFQRGPGGLPRFGVRRPFPTTPRPNNFIPANLPFKLIYVQKVSVPLDQLYKGVDDWKFTLVDTWWTRWRAAIRGKFAYLSFYQALTFSLPILRTSKFLAFCVALVVSHATIPKPDPRRIYETKLPRGSKGGKTKVRFGSTRFSQPEVVFEIFEAPHDIYSRVGNDLHADLVISNKEAKMGCTKRIPSLEEEEGSIEVALRPNQIRTSGETIRITGKGWPVRNGPDVYLHGDMVVRVIIKKNRSKKKKKNPSP